MKWLLEKSKTPLPPSGIDGVAWPAIPSPINSGIFSLAYPLEHSQWWDPDTLSAFQLHQAGELIRHARRTVPFYRERLKGVAKSPHQTLTMADFKRIPLLGREDLRDHKDELTSNKLPPDHQPVHDISTSGSTGRLVTMTGSCVTAYMNAAIAVRWHAWHERMVTRKLADIRVARHSAAGESPPPQGWGNGFYSGPMVTIGASLPVEQQIEWLEHEAPYYLLTYPTNLEALLDHCAKSDVKFANLCEVMTRGEAFGPELREKSLEVWGVPVTDAYGAEELGFIALQCPEGAHYHVQSEHVLVEVLGEDGNEVEPGSTGQVVVTDLHNFATPLIRYALEDHAVMGQACPCGRGLPVLDRVMGRTRNMFILPSGERFWPTFSRAIEKLQTNIPKIRQIQVIQRTHHEVAARMVVSGPLGRSEETQTKNKLAEALGGHFEVELEFTDAIERSASGKFEQAICRVDPD